MIDAGYAPLPNSLIEALSCAPLSAGEFRVVMFIIRRTIGWARRNDPRYEADTITAAQIASGTRLPRRTVEDCLLNLQRKGVIWSVQVRTDNTKAYGVETDIDAWGDGRGDWNGFRPDRLDARDRGDYTRGSTEEDVQVYGGFRRGIRRNSYMYTEEPVKVGASSPTDTGAEGTPTDSSTDSSTYTSCAEVETPPADTGQRGTNGYSEVQHQPSPETPPAKANTRRTKPLIDHEALRSELLTMFTDDERPLCIDFLEVCRLANKTQAIEASRECTLLRELAAIKEKYPKNGALAHGLMVTITKGINRTGYVRECAKSYAERPVNEGGLFGREEKNSTLPSALPSDPAPAMRTGADSVLNQVAAINAAKAKREEDACGRS